MIDSVAVGHEAEVISADYPKPMAAEDLPEVTYWAPMESQKWGITEFGSFTQNGPLPESMWAVPKGVRQIVGNAERKKYYGISGHEVVEIDPHTHTSLPMDMGMDVPELSWPCGIAFDTKRQRLLVASLGGEGFLYSYDTATKAWSVLTSMNNVEISALSYSAKQDALFALDTNRSSSSTELLKLSADGNPLGVVKLGDPIMPGMIAARPHDSSVILADAGDYLAIIATEITRDRKAVTRTFLVNPDTGSALFAGAQ